MRLFTGIPVNEPFQNASKKLSLLNQRISGFRWVPDVNLHVTTCFIGESAASNLLRLTGLTRTVVSMASGIILELEDICVWPRKNPYMVWALFRENEGFTLLYRNLEVALIGNAGKGAVKPHVTLARFKEGAAFKELNLTAADFPTRLEGSELILYESVLLPKGPDYRIIERFPIPNRLPNP